MNSPQHGRDRSSFHPGVVAACAVPAATLGSSRQVVPATAGCAPLVAVPHPCSYSSLSAVQHPAGGSIADAEGYHLVGGSTAAAGGRYLVGSFSAAGGLLPSTHAGDQQGQREELSWEMLQLSAAVEADIYGICHTRGILPVSSSASAREFLCTL